MVALPDFLRKQYPFRPQSFELPCGNNMSYVDVGEGPTVVMLHGNPSWSFYYRNLIKLLQKSYRVIVPDHIGCGLSDKPQKYPYRLRKHIDNVCFLLEHLKVEKTSLVVHDWGGAIGMGYAVRNIPRIQSIVILNTAAFRSRHIPFRIKICRIPVFGDLVIRGLNGFARSAVFMAVTRKMSPETVKGFLYPYNSWKNRIATLRFVQDIPLSEHEPSYNTLREVEKGLHAFQSVPILICWGGRDFCFNDHFYSKWQKIYPHATCHYFPDAGHYVLEDAFEDIGPLVHDFFDKQKS
ncbi:MAG: alpha/beta fold hydrolase [Desulfobulbaceae bacterium]|uniref:Alpha/beta fold hydrolase n=1 Tax=Candidatus Desulfobia pelagia TaxID=2841692 RepID=A0A8J6NBZ8_9BACT|nr:alpha/beta fold hydrolase [Candidatus Desulfobia pelagia]